MAEFGGALDRYLEAPYVNAARDEADYERWCEENGLDAGDNHWTEFEAARADEFDNEPDHDWHTEKHGW